MASNNAGAMLEAWHRVPVQHREAFLSHLSEDERKLILDNAIKAITGARNTRWESPFALQQAIDPNALPARHFELLGDLWRRAETEQVYATVSISVRMGKSTQLARYGPAWFLDRNPNSRVLITTNTADLAQEHSRFARSLIVEHPEMFEISVADDSAAVNKWSVAGQSEGGLTAIGSNGSFIGKGFNVAIVDDPYPSFKMATSPAFSKGIWDWFMATILNRQEPKASIIVIMARWNEDDLVGRIHSELPGEFENITIPAIAVENDVLGREPGEALWPARFDEEALAKIKRTQRKIWGPQYQQDVSGTASGTEIAVDLMGRWKVDTSSTHFMVRRPNSEDWERDYPVWRFGTVDWAVGTSENSDYTVLARWNYTLRKNVILEAIHVFRSGNPAPMVAARVKAAGKWYPVIAEAIGIQNKLNNELRRLGVGVVNANVGARGDKKTRNIDTVLLINQERIFVPNPDLLPEQVVLQLRDYPNSDHDDVVDVFSTAANVANGKLVGIEAKDRKRIQAMVRNSMKIARRDFASSASVERQSDEVRNGR